ncbi:hypothetical protein MMX123_00776 [Microbacterium sp. MM2322]
MSTALRSVVPFFPSIPRLRGVVRRLDAVPTMHVGAAALIVLVGGLLLSIATTSDPLWWQLHFSQLGTFHDLSAAFFNNTLKVSGMIVVYFAFRVRRDVRRLGRGPVRRGAATIAFLCLNVIGVNLALVGCIPLNTDKDLHDRVAGSMVLGFLALLLTSPVLFHRLGKRMAIGTGVALVWLIISIALFVSATINLALFETIACAAMFAWAGMFTHIVASAQATAVRAPDAGTPHVVHLAPRRRAHRSSIARRAVGRASSTTPSVPLVARALTPAGGRGAFHPEARGTSRATASVIQSPMTPALTTPPASTGRTASTATCAGPVPRRRTVSGPGLVSGSRAALGGSAGERRRSASRRTLPLGPPVAPDAARLLPR